MLVQLADCLAVAGPVLIVAKGKKECERLAGLMLEWQKKRGAARYLSSSEFESEAIQRLDARLEREMYSAVPMRGMLRNRIAYHHAGLPPQVRVALEEAVRRNLVQFVFATTTLAEGVNFPFASVVVQSLALREPPQRGRPSRYQPLTPRVFWNLAGRAGRPQFDREGQVILFKPSLGLEKIRYVLRDYLNPALATLNPVRSALAQAIEDVADGIDKGDLTVENLTGTQLAPEIPRKIQGAVNLIRVSLLHAKASKLGKSPEEIFDQTFAARFLDIRHSRLAKQLFSSQGAVVEEFLTSPDALSAELAAELGLSIQTLSELRDYVRSLKDWQIENMQRLLFGGTLNLNQARYLVGPVAKRMAELEGPTLGGFLSEVILLWLTRIPFSSMLGQLKGSLRKGGIEDLIAIIYSRVQFLLPWGLYAMDQLVEAEARRRRIRYDNEVCSLAYLADAGVSSFDALRLVAFEFERTDAVRLAEHYRTSGGLRLGVDIIGWVAGLSLRNVIACVRGRDQRRVDYDLERRHGTLKERSYGG